MSVSTESTATHAHEEAAIDVEGMTCASCVAHVQKAAAKLPGVREARVNLALGRAVVSYDPQQVDPGQIAQAISGSGYPASPQTAGQSHTHHHADHAQIWLRRAIVGIALWFPVELTHWIIAATSHHHPLWMEWIAMITSTIAIVYVGRGFYFSAWNALKHGTSNMDTLIAMGASVAYVYSLIAFIGYLAGWWGTLPNLYFMESTGLLALISLGHWLEARARESAGKSIRELMELAPATARRLMHPLPGGERAGVRGESLNTEPSAIGDSPPSPQPSPLRGEGEWEEIPVANLKIGDMVLVRPGDRVPIDGVIISGTSNIDEAMLSGEPLPVARGPGDTVIGGTVNQDGALRVRVTKVGSETALAQIVKLVEDAQSAKPPVQKLADQVAAIFVPVVLGIALLTGVGWYIWGAAHDWPSAQIWGRVALTVCSVLIIACPCALGLAVPAALMVGTGRGARMGILIRNIDALQMAERIDTVVLDKTGTLTRGRPAVGQVISLNGMSEQEILRLAASAEQFSEHPIARAIVRAAAEKSLRLTEPSGFTNDPGHGVIAQVGEQTLLVGSEALLEKRGASSWTKQAPRTGTMVVVAVQSNGHIEPIGRITVVDQLKPDSAEAVRSLHSLKLRTVLLTGDNRAAAEEIARQVGIDDVHAEVKPGGKANVVRELQNRKSHVAMVGDGINDAPALAQADLGIAIGSGSDIAKETGDIVLVGESLHGVAAAIRLSRATMTKIRQNLFFAFLYNVLAIPLAALGLLNPLIAAAAMALSDVTVIGNALLLRRTRL